MCKLVMNNISIMDRPTNNVYTGYRLSTIRGNQQSEVTG